MDFHVEKVLGTSAHNRNAVTMVALKTGQYAYVACVGAGAILNQVKSTHHPALEGELHERFYYHPPKPGSSELIAPGSPKGSPDSAGSGHKLVRVNKAGCVAANANVSMVAVGEASGYMPRLLLYDLLSGECLSVLRDQHQFGVQHLRFSPSGQYLASMGTPQDGFLYVWNVKDGHFELQASNRCISEVRDIAWLNDDQFVTCGIRHIKLWTVGSESILPGRSILLKETLDQTFECVCPASSALGGGMVVGTARGDVYKMPEIQHLITVSPQEPIKSIVAIDAAFPHVLVSTQHHIYEFKDSFATPSKVYPYGTAALLTLGYDVFFLSPDAEKGLVLPLPASEKIPLASAGANEIPFKSVQLRSNADGKVILWRSGENLLYRWPNEHVEVPLSDITTAYPITAESDPMVGSLCGDLWLGRELFNAHNGPITDLHQLGPVAVSSGRDRCVQVWLCSDDSWKLMQTLMFTSPILKAKLCTRSDGAYALVCCAANKTVYFYMTRAPLTDSEGPIFPDSPKSMLLKGMPFDLAVVEDIVALSTNDKHISVVDPFAEQEKLRLTWRVYNANMESVNATHIEIITHEETRYLLVGGSDKCTHLFTFPKGDLVASQWGHGEAVSGVAWTGREVLSAGDSIMVSTIKASANERPRLSRARSSTHMEMQVQSKSPSLPRFVIPNQASSKEPASPPRKVYNTSRPPRPRSVSPQRMMASSRNVSRSPSPTRERVPPPSRLSEPSGTPSIRDKDSDKTGLSYKPLRLATPTTQARNIAAAAAASPTRQDPTANLEAALQSFIDLPLSNNDTTKLKTLLVSALNKIDGFTLVEEFSDRLCGSIEARLDSKLSDLLKKA